MMMQSSNSASGVTPWLLLTGVLPPADFGRRIPIGQTSAYISEGFAVIIDKTMELSPDMRYQNGREYLKAIQNPYGKNAAYYELIQNVENSMKQYDFEKEDRLLE